MDFNIFGFSDYKAYLKAVLHAKPKRGHGFKSEMAKAMGCHPAYVSQVLSGRAEFSSEQAEALNLLLSHSSLEAEFFLLLVQRERAGTAALKSRIDVRIKQLQSERLELSRRVEAMPEVPEEKKPRYYSAWIYAACHIATTLPQHQTVAEIAASLHMEEDVVATAIGFLIDAGLVVSDRGLLKPGPSRVYLKSDSPLTIANHRNWRLKAIAEIESYSPPRGLHFSGLFSLSFKDATVIRDELIEKVSAIRSVVKGSPAEELHVLGLDFFKIGGGVNR